MLQQVEDDFPFLPAGCTVDLDRQSRELVLDNLKAAIRRSRWATLVADLKTADAEVGLAAFLERFHHRVEDVYRQGRSWTRLCRDAGHPVPSAHDVALEEAALKAASGLTHVDDPERVGAYSELLGASQPPRMETLDVRQRRLLTMLAWGLRSERDGHVDLDG